MFGGMFGPKKDEALNFARASGGRISVKVVGVGGAGCNAVQRMVNEGVRGVDFLALNTDVQVLSRMRGMQRFAIGPNTTRGMGSGGQPDVGKKAIKESQEQVAQLLEGADMVFITAGMGGGTGTGVASIVSELARKQGALTVGVVTLPFAFEGPHRKAVAQQGLHNLQQKVDTLIVVDNNRLLPSLRGKVTLTKAFQLADEVLRQGVQGISEIVTLPGVINVDFADVKAIMTNGGPSFMAVGEGKGELAAHKAALAALSNPLFDAPLEGASGILFNIKGGEDLTLGQVHEVAGLMREATKAQTNVMFGIVQDPRLKKRVSITLVATGLKRMDSAAASEGEDGFQALAESLDLSELVAGHGTNGHASPEAASATRRLI
ncbi:MAG: cell division protein FtsZ [Chloroflexi bacterium]|nr:cell division protein FtsZ [Chloroflexota bacterium]